MPETFASSRSIQLSGDVASADFKRADIRFHGVDHSGATYEARIFLNNPGANEQTERSAANGYAGAFHIFGHGGCFGDEGHCDVPEQRRPFDRRPAHPLEPAEKSVVITDALRRALQNGPSVQVTVVPVVMSGNEKTEGQNPLKFDNFEVVTYAG